MKKVNFLMVFMLASVVYFTSCKTHKTENAVEEPHKVCVSDTMRGMITIDTAKLSNINDELILSGEVSFDDNKVVKIFPFASGQVLDVKVGLGDKVSKGQILAEIKSADVAQNYNDLEAAKSDVVIAKRQLENIKSLYQSGISSEREFTEAKENYQKALSAYKKIEESIAINGSGNTSAGGTYILRSPSEGFIVEKKINTGDFIRDDNAENIFTISDLKDVWVLANVYEADISRVQEGYTAKVTTLAYPDKVFMGKVDKISQVLDPENKVMKVRITLPNTDNLLKTEMFTNVVVTNKEDSKAIEIPSDAVIMENGKSYVIVYKSDCDLSVRQVEVIQTVEHSTYISSGLNAGERIISKNQILFYRALTDK
jgi:membrane fusion protein, heavy metal efflux system